jgi:hypothetical protein
MNFINKKIKPALIDKHVLNEFIKIKYPEPVKIIHLPPVEPSDLQKLSSKIGHNILSFLYNYFIIIFIIIIIILYLWNRYNWYKNIKKDKEKQNDNNDIKKYFDNIFEESKNIKYVDNNSNSNVNNNNISNKNVNNNNISNKNLNISNKNVNNNNISNKNVNNNNISNKHVNNKEKFSVDKNNNNIKDNLVNNTTQEIAMSRDNISNFINIQTKMTQFEKNGTFDAFDRNFLNSKTGDVLAANENSKYTPF